VGRRTHKTCQTGMFYVLEGGVGVEQVPNTGVARFQVGGGGVEWAVMG